jgi:hypothetical protein
MSPPRRRLARLLSARSNAELFNLPVPNSRHDAHLSPDFETFDVARARRRRLLGLLVAPDKAAQTLKFALTGCRKSNRCGSAGCDVCLRRFRRRWAGTVARYIEADKRDWFTMNLVPPCLAYPIGMLHQFDPRRWKDSFRKQIERSGLASATMIGGLDFAIQSLGSSLVWRPHLYCFVAAGSKKIVRKALAENYPRTKSVPVPLLVKPLDQNTLVHAITYSFKATFKERHPSRDKRGNADTNEWDLSAEHLAELAPLLHIWGFTGRLFRRGLLQDDTQRVAAVPKRLLPYAEW